MVKSKLARLPDEQRCHFLIGPTSSWFVPNTCDIWSKPCPRDTGSHVSPNESMDCDDDLRNDNSSLSYFIYGCLGCFCYGEIYQQLGQSQDHIPAQQVKLSSPIAALTNRLIDIKEDNSRVICVRFSKESPFPLAMALTESGSLVLHDCLKSKNIAHYKKSEILHQYGKVKEPTLVAGEPSNKRPKMDVTQQISSFVWPKTGHCFVGISLRKERTNMLLWLKLDCNLLGCRDNKSIDKHDIIKASESIEFNHSQHPSPICLMESTMVEYSGSMKCLIGVATDDGLITVICKDLETGHTGRLIKLERHDDQICSMSFEVQNTKKFPLGLLASVSRNGLVLVWDIEKEFYFADYSPDQELPRNATKINWYSVSFVPTNWTKQTNLVVSNQESSLTVLELPKNTISKTRLREKNSKKQQNDYDQSLRHRALVFGIVYNEPTKTIMTTSLDGNHLFWSVEKPQQVNDSAQNVIVKPRHLLPSLPNTARTHMLRHSPIREDFMALALGKAGVKFFKVGRTPNHHRFDMNQSCSFIAKKLAKASVSPTSVAWHPSHEYRLAIGTIEGKVFRADLTPRSGAAVLEAEYKFSESPKKADDLFGVDYQPLKRDEQVGEQAKSVNKCDGIYSLCWGPNPISPDDRSRYAIYAIGSISHRLFIYCSTKEDSDKLTDYLEDFRDESLVEAKSQCSEVSWKTSMDLMALGTTDGKIIITTYLEESHSDRSTNRLFKKLLVIEGPLGNSYIQCLAWHPTSEPEDSFYYYIAASANESPAFVFNLKENILVDDINTRLKIEHLSSIKYMNSSANSLASFVCKLSSHTKPISDISWSPHEPNELATASFDRLCYVWSLNKTNEGCSAHIKAKFAARDRLFTLDWSLVDPDLIYTSGQDSTVWAWRPSENTQSAKDSDQQLSLI